MPFEIGDWVRNSENEIVKVESIDRQGGTATVHALDVDQSRVVPVTYPIEALIKFEIER